MKLQSKVAIITGAGQGIGRASALALAREGASIAVCDLEYERAEKVANEIKALGQQALPLKADVSRISEIDQMIEKTVAAFKEVNILVNTVSGEKIVPALQLTEADWDMMLDTGVKATFFCCQRFAKQVISQKRGNGKIINIASVSAHVGTPNYTAYCASKAGIIQITKALGVEWIRLGINVNAVSPGVTLTPRVEKATREHPEFFKPYFDRIPRKQPAQPEEIANAVLFLATPDANHIVGQVIIVDGGALALHPGYVWPEQ